jgi:hypothetical protein
MSLSNYEMEIIRRKSEQEPEVIDRLFSKKPDAAKQYAVFLVKNDQELPENLLKIVSSSVGMDNFFAKISAMLKLKGSEVPKSLMERLLRTRADAADYAEAVLSEDSTAEIEPEVFEKIMEDDEAARMFTINILQDNPEVELPEEMVALLKYSQQASYNIAIKQLQNRIKKYEDLDKNIIEAIARDPRLASRFAHFVQPFVDETPEEILKNIQDPKTIRAKWHTGITVKENFKDFFKSRN